ncbi:MAG: PEGA domain-containing protein [Myxococcota bacterium]
MLPIGLAVLACTPLSDAERVLLLVDEEAAQLRGPLDEAPFNWMPPAAAQRALDQEGGAEQRRRRLQNASRKVRDAEAAFRELEDEPALDLLTEAITELASVHQEVRALELLARAHLLSGAIFMARGRFEAGRNRLQRALDIDPELDPSRARFSPRVISELAALRERSRPTGRLEIQAEPNGAQVFLDGRPRGQTPAILNDVPEGRHLLRVSRVGHVSHLSSVEVRSDELTHRRLRLVSDPEVRRVADVHALLRTGETVEEVLDILAKRARADRTLAVTLSPSESPREDGRARMGAILALGGAGQTRSLDLSTASIQGALDRLASCRDTALPPRAFAAPPLAAFSRGQSSLPRPRSTSWYRRPWVWAVAGTVALGVATAAVAARASSGVPDGLEFEVTPRP